MLLSILGITQNVRIKQVFSVNKSKYKIKCVIVCNGNET